MIKRETLVLQMMIALESMRIHLLGQPEDMECERRYKTDFTFASESWE